MTDTETRLTTDELDALLVDLEAHAQPAPEPTKKLPANFVATVVRRGLLIFVVTVIAFLASLGDGTYDRTIPTSVPSGLTVGGAIR